MWRLAALYHPASLRQKGLLGFALLLVTTALLIAAALGWYWSRPPDAFDVREATARGVGADGKKTGGRAVYTSTLIEVGDVLLTKSGDYLFNDRLPPGVWLDNMPNWEFGALVMLRDGTAALRNDISRSRSQSVEDIALAEAEPRFNFRNDSWLFSPTESECRKGLQALADYLAHLHDPGQRQAQFFARADNLRQHLEIVEKRLASRSQRLSASVGQIRVNTDLAGDSDAQQSTATPGTVFVKTPWLELNDVFLRSARRQLRVTGDPAACRIRFRRHSEEEERPGFAAPGDSGTGRDTTSDL